MGWTAEKCGSCYPILVVVVSSDTWVSLPAAAAAALPPSLYFYLWLQQRVEIHALWRRIGVESIFFFLE